MEVDLWQPSSLDAGPSGLLPTIDESGDLGPQDPKDRLIKVLDQVEARVERLRKDAARIEEEKDTLLATLDAVKHSEWMTELNEFERDDVQHTLGRVLSRCLTVETFVRTNRDPHQEEALNQVNQYIDNLVMGVKQDPISAKARCQSFMSACSSIQHQQNMRTPGADPNFECAILGCTVDDQKRVKKRLQGLLDYFAKLNITST